MGVVDISSSLSIFGVAVKSPPPPDIATFNGVVSSISLIAFIGDDWMLLNFNGDGSISDTVCVVEVLRGYGIGWTGGGFLPLHRARHEMHATFRKSPNIEPSGGTQIK